MITYQKEIENKVMKKVAKNLIRLNVPLEKIKAATNLAEDVIKKLLKRNNRII